MHLKMRRYGSLIMFPGIHFIDEQMQARAHTHTQNQISKDSSIQKDKHMLPTPICYVCQRQMTLTYCNWNKIAKHQKKKQQKEHKRPSFEDKHPTKASMEIPSRYIFRLRDNTNFRWICTYVCVCVSFLYIYIHFNRIFHFFFFFSPYFRNIFLKQLGIDLLSVYTLLIMSIANKMRAIIYKFQGMLHYNHHQLMSPNYTIIIILLYL